MIIINYVIIYIKFCFFKFFVEIISSKRLFKLFKLLLLLLLLLLFLEGNRLLKRRFQLYKSSFEETI